MRKSPFFFPVGRGRVGKPDLGRLPRGWGRPQFQSGLRPGPGRPKAPAPAAPYRLMKTFRLMLFRPSSARTK